MNSSPGSLPFRRLLVLASKPKGRSPSQRFRLEQWAPRLEQDHNIRLDFVPFESEPLADILYEPGRYLSKSLWVGYDFLRRAAAVMKTRRYDGVVIHREASLIGPAIYERLIAWTGKPIIFDFDDSIWSPAQEMRHSFLSRLHFFGKTKSICRLAAAVSAGNEFLANYARQWNDRVFVIPTSIELADYPLVPEPQGDRPFVICWTGSSSTLAHFEFGRAALEQLARRVPLAVKVICDRPPQRPIAGAEMRFVRWSKEREAEELGDSHVGIMPLPDNEATRGKCGLKALQCMATGKPVVISPVGMNEDLIRHGQNGFLASSTEEYVECLLKLAQSPELRQSMGEAARLTVEEGYSAEAVAKKFAKMARSVMD